VNLPGATKRSSRNGPSTCTLTRTPPTTLEAEGLGPKLKDKNTGEQYITFKRKELKGDGTPNQPIRIVDHRGNAWDNRKIGNGSTVNVNFAINEFKPKQFAANILSLQVWDYVSFTGNEFPIRDADNTKQAEDWSQEATA
jgi:hypothetical protein